MMPLYRYRSKASSSCPTCRPSFEVFQKMSDEPVTLCHACGADVYRVLGRVKFKIDRFTKVDREYREDLARNTVEIAADPNTPASWRPGQKDPEAFVDGPRALAKLLDKRKREGWVEDPNLWSKALEGQTEPEADSTNMVEEAFNQAAACDFTLDEDE